MDLSNWQAALPDSTVLSMINLPGTHNSATQFVSLSLLSRCQGKSILEQLESGARLLDIRLELSDGIFTAVHGIANCHSSKSRRSSLLSFDMIFNDIKTFIDLNPTETIIVSLKMDRGQNYDDFFPTFYKSFIEECPSVWFLENRIPNLDECRGKMLLMRRCGLGKSKIIFNDLNSGVNCTGMNAQDEMKNALTLPHKIKMFDNQSENIFITVQDKYMYNPIAKWKKAVKPMLEHVKSDNKTIVINFLSTAGLPFIPFTNAKYVNSKFNRFLLTHTKPYGWIAFDFLTKELAAKVINSNF